MGLIPLAERSGIDLDDGALDKGVRSDEFVVGGVVDLITVPPYQKNPSLQKAGIDIRH